MVHARRRRSLVPGSRARQPRSARRRRVSTRRRSSRQDCARRRTASACTPIVRTDSAQAACSGRSAAPANGAERRLRREAASSDRTPAARGVPRRRRSCRPGDRAPADAPGPGCATPPSPGRSLKLIEMSIGITVSPPAPRTRPSGKSASAARDSSRKSVPFNVPRRNAERIGIRDSRPEPHPGAVQPQHADLGRTAGHLFESRRLHEGAEAAERPGTRLERENRHGGNDESGTHHTLEGARLAPEPTAELGCRCNRGGDQDAWVVAAGA